MYRPTSVALFVGSMVLFGGCVAQTAEPDLCVQAQAHLQACGGMQDSDVFIAPTCDPDAAQAILEQPCESLADPGKADFWGRFLCRLGILRHCAVAVCDAPGEFEAELEGSCAALIDLDGCGQCDYYRCREARSEASCGASGYYLAFGQRYCQRFQQVTEDRLSIEGQAWSQRVRPCLMRALERAAGDELSCIDISRVALDSHPACYAETGFCDLPVSDWVLVLNTIDPADRDLREMM
ncbi:MAG TPA: hypothetical protein ENK57_22295, partial [Polyangiaceae bacterium]|nr:hypothetical protein [Polyangiaceae bacterium]